MHRAHAYKGSKLGPEKQARQNPKVGSGTGPAVKPYRNRSKCNIRGKCSICSDSLIGIALKKYAGTEVIDYVFLTSLYLEIEKSGYVLKSHKASLYSS
jgi:hypothetical protein